MSDQPPQIDLSSHPKGRAADPAPRPAPGRPEAYGGYYGAPPPAAGLPFEVRHVFDYVRIVYKRRWTAATAFLFIVVTTLVYTYTRVPIYRSATRVLIQTQRENYGVKDVSTGIDQTPNYLQTQYAIIQSRFLARKTMESLGIWHGAPKEDGNAPPAPAPKPGFFAWAKSVVLSTVGLAGQPPGSPAAQGSETAADARQIDAFLGGLSIQPVPGSSLVDIAYTSSDPTTSARYSNALAQQYVAQNLEFKSTASREANDWLTDRLTEQRQKVEGSEQALQKYREQNGVAVLDERANPALQGLAEMSASVTKAKTDRIEKESIYKQLHGLQAVPGGLDSFPAVMTNPTVAQAKEELVQRQRALAVATEKLGEKHPDLQKAREAVRASEQRLQAEIARAVTAIESDFEAAQATERMLVQTFETQKRQALAVNRSGVELAVLTRDLESNRQIYDNLTSRAKEVGLTNEIKTNNVKVLDVAEVPRAPVYPNSRKNVQYGLFGGLVFALSLVFLLEYLDNRIKSPDEIKAELGLPFLGIVPAAGAGKTPLVNNGAPMNFAEAFGALRTNVLFSSTDEGARVVVVTSTGPGEGKTLVAANLAIAIAQTGQRVLIIDGDLRRPRVHEVFAVKQEPGLSNLLTGSAKTGEVMRTWQVPDLWVLPSGHIPPNPAVLLGSKRFKEFLTRLDEHFDWVVIDSPPVLAVTDAAVLAHVASGVLFVTSAEMTNRESARTAIEQLCTARARFLGVVLNRVDLDRHAYYYSKYYHKGYGRYYHAEAGKKAEPRRPQA